MIIIVVVFLRKLAKMELGQLPWNSSIIRKNNRLCSDRPSSWKDKKMEDQSVCFQTFSGL